MSPLGPTSWALVAAVKRGEMDAFGELYRLHAATVRRFLRLRTADRDLVEDLTSETFARALRHITSVVDQGKEVEAWLFTIARNALLDQRKRACVRREIAVAELEQRMHSVHELNIDHIDMLPPRRELVRCFEALTEEQRQCITLRILQDKSVKATAEAMDRSPEAIRALHHRAIRQLRARLAGVSSTPVAMMS